MCGNSSKRQFARRWLTCYHGKLLTHFRGFKKCARSSRNFRYCGTPLGPGYWEQYRSIMTRINRDGWRKYLSEIDIADTSALFASLARSEDPGKKLNKFPCAAPVRGRNSNLIIEPHAKPNLLALHLATKFNDPTIASSGAS